jgi:hypothetical protein
VSEWLLFNTNMSKLSLSLARALSLSRTCSLSLYFLILCVNKVFVDFNNFKKYDKNLVIFSKWKPTMPNCTIQIIFSGTTKDVTNCLIFYYWNDWFGLWYVKPLSTLRPLYNGVSFVGGGVPGEDHRPVASHWQTSSHNVVSSTPHYERGSNSQLWLHSPTTKRIYISLITCFRILLINS